MNAFKNPSQTNLPISQDPTKLAEALRATQQQLLQAEARIAQLQQALQQAYAHLNKVTTKGGLPASISQSSADPLSLSWDLEAEEKQLSHQQHTLHEMPESLIARQDPLFFPGDRHAYTASTRAQFASLSASNKPVPPHTLDKKANTPIPQVHELQGLTEETIESSLRDLAVELKKAPTPSPASLEDSSLDPMATFCDPEAAKKHFDQLSALRAVFAAQQMAQARGLSKNDEKYSPHGQTQAVPPPLPTNKSQVPPPPFQAPNNANPPEIVQTSSSPFEPMPRRVIPVDKTVDASHQDILALLRK